MPGTGEAQSPRTKTEQQSCNAYRSTTTTLTGEKGTESHNYVAVECVLLRISRIVQ
jgi:hypothetical protein